MNTPSDSSDRNLLLSAYAVNELDERERAEIERQLAADPQSRQTAEELRRLAAALREARGGMPHEKRSDELRQLVDQRLDELKAEEAKVAVARPAEQAWRRRLWISAAVAVCLIVIAYPLGMGAWNSYEASKQERLHGIAGSFSRADSISKKAEPRKSVQAVRGQSLTRDYGYDPQVRANPKPTSPLHGHQEATTTGAGSPDGHAKAGTGDATSSPAITLYNGQQATPADKMAQPTYEYAPWQPVHSPKPTTGGGQDWTRGGTGTVGQGQGRGEVSKSGDYVGWVHGAVAPYPLPVGVGGIGDPYAHGEQYQAIVENIFLPVDKATALSTFSIDVDTASYSNVRRFLSQNQLPPPNAVRIEELLNYFSYSYPQPKGEDPFSVNMELADCPWQPGHQLLRIGLKGKEVHAKERKASNLVFLVDVSGSMQPENRLPLLKQAFKMLTGELTENDRVTIVTYAGDAGLRLDATNGTRQNEIRSAIDSLSAGGSTHGSAGIELAYQKAAQSFIKDGMNRVILATDGDLNVGITSDEALVDLIKTKAASGVFLTVLGVGEGNLKDSKMEKLADNGNGVYAYLDSLREARKVLVEQLSGSLETIAKDVKLQIEFNPAEVQAYRLIGYENRVLAERDFHDDKKDAGEIGAGHTVTALYELVPARVKAEAKTEQGAPLKYQRVPERKVSPEALTAAAAGGEILTLKLRHKKPDGQTSELREYPLKSEGGRFNRASADFQFAAAVASFGMLLRGSQHRGDATFSAIEEIASGAIGTDPGGYRAEFLDLVRKAKTLGK